MKTSKNQWLRRSMIFAMITGCWGIMGIAQANEGGTTKEFTTTMTGEMAKDKSYVDAGVMKEDGNYHFSENTVVNTANAHGSIFYKKTTIKADKELTFKLINNSPNKLTFAGLNVHSTDEVKVEAQKLNFHIEGPTGRVEGIEVGGQGSQNKGNPYRLTIDGDVDFDVVGSGYTLGLYSAGEGDIHFKGNITSMGKNGQWGVTSTKGAYGYYGCSLIYAGNSYSIQTGPKVVIEGNVNAKVDANALFANGGHSKVIVNGGGYIEVNGENDNGYYALLAECALTSMNVQLNSNPMLLKANHNDVVIKGDIAAGTGAVHQNEPELYSQVNLGLDTPNSTWTGAAFNMFQPQGNPTVGNKVFRGIINIILQNGATWNNQLWGIGKVPMDGKPHEFDGSHVTNFIGGDTVETTGYIYQNLEDEPLKIDNYKGNTTIFYKHSSEQKDKLGKGWAPIGGSTIIERAEPGSKIFLLTGNEALNTKSNKAIDKNLVNGTLNALANKLFYLAYTKGENNLIGKVGIAEGLTTESVSKTILIENQRYSIPSTENLKTITFDKNKHGRGQYIYTPQEGDSPEPPTPKPEPQPENKPAETLMMNGGKNAMALAATIWLSNNNDLQRRMGDIRLSQAKSGLWARYLGGKNVWNPEQTNIDQQYNILQIGYDTKVNEWNIGGAFDYGTSNDTYFIKDLKGLVNAKGDGKEKQYTFALYAIGQFDNGQYVDIIAKMAKVNSRYNLNYLDKQMNGDYNTRGGSISIEYGKRISEGDTYIEPSIEFTAGYLDAVNYKANSTFQNNGIDDANMTIHQDAFHTLRGRLGIAAGRQTDMTSAFVKLSLNKEFSGNFNATFRADGDTEDIPVNLDMKDTWVDIEIGGSYRMEKGTFVYGTLTKSFHSAIKTEWRLDAGIRLAF